MVIQMLGMETIDTTFTFGGQDINLTFGMQASSFHLEMVTVTAQESRSGLSTSTTVGRAAIDHTQISDLSGIMQLLPGGQVSNPNLAGGSYFSIRGLNSTNISDNAMNSLGTAIIMDGAPISTSANLQTLGTTRTGGLDAPESHTGRHDTRILGAGGGVDLRTISTDNIESVEVIRGIPSVEHGDLTSGAVIIRSRAGYEPLTVRIKANPNIYEANVSKGIRFTENRGSLNPSLNYAYGAHDLTHSYSFFQRVNAHLVYSNMFFGRLNSTSTFGYVMGKDTRKINPDDITSQTESGATNTNIRLNTRGNWRFDDLWLKNINYVFSADIGNQNSFYRTLVGNADAPFTTSRTHGSVLTSLGPNVVIHDTAGNILTNVPAAERDATVIFMPATYRESYDIHGRPINIFGQLQANFVKQFTPWFNNRIVVGMDFKRSGNLGDGLTFDPLVPPYRYVSNSSATLRPRPFKDIPFVNQLGLYVEENILMTIADRNLAISAGVRHDRVGKLSATTPRLNASFEIIPRMLSIRGGYGITAKAPTSIHLHPDYAYFDYVNYRATSATSGTTENQQFMMISTYKFDVDVSNLKMATNRKAEVGLDLRLGQVSFHATYYDEAIRNGFRMGSDLSTFNMIRHTTYDHTSSETPHILQDRHTRNLFASYSRPLNDATVLSRGFEFDINTGRIRDIRTAFVLTGAYQRLSSWNDGYRFESAVDGTQPTITQELFIGVFDPRNRTSEIERLTTSLRAIHNIPRIGFVVSLTAQVVWMDKVWMTYGQDSIPLKYISYKDGLVHDFTHQMYLDAVAGLQPGANRTAFSPLVDRARNMNNRLLETPLSYKPYMLVNLNLTKELGDFLTVSFFANNMFSQHPVRESTRVAGSFARLNINTPLFFGVELRATIR
jgi:hypothetical protein